MSDSCFCKCIQNYKKMRRVALFGVASIGTGAGIYLCYKRYIQLEEDKEYYREYTQENPQEDYKSRMDFYESEFKRQDEEEEKELKKAVDEFNSRRLNRESCPVCGNRRRLKNRKNRRENKSEYENYIYLEK